MSELPITYLPDAFTGPFPPTRQALAEPNGLLAVGGNLEPETLLEAYRHGIFPWYSDNQPVLWWSPNPRCVIFPEKLHISRSLRRTLNKKPFEITLDTAFYGVIEACSMPRKTQDSTWITDEMKKAYYRLHELGYAHSIECWQNNQLVGGMYGVQLGQVFFGESMFSKVKDASKVAMVYLFEKIRPALLDGQVYSEHLQTMGAENIDRFDFEQLLNQYC